MRCHTVAGGGDPWVRWSCTSGAEQRGSWQNCGMGVVETREVDPPGRGMREEDMGWEGSDVPATHQTPTVYGSTVGAEYCRVETTRVCGTRQGALAAGGTNVVGHGGGG